MTKRELAFMEDFRGLIQKHGVVIGATEYNDSIDDSPSIHVFGDEICIDLYGLMLYTDLGKIINENKHES
jgi:hypothetical protein